MTAHDLPVVEAMRERAFVPTGGMDFFGGVLVMEAFDIVEVRELSAARLPYDEDVVDCSHRLFEITTAMLVSDHAELSVACFPSRRWRNLREGGTITAAPSRETPLIYLGNPIVVLKDAQGLHVISSREFRIRSGPELGY